MKKEARILATLLLGLSLILSGCATPASRNTNDPYERFNRACFQFNRELDKYVIRPVADVYDTVIPIPVHHGISNAFSNFYEPSRIINELLQADLSDAANDTGRFLINSTFGVVGLFDIATKIGLPKHQNDLGLTFAKWGYRSSNYIVLPFFGSTTVRDMVAYPINIYAFTPWLLVEPPSLAWSMYGTEQIHYRSLLLPADKVINNAFDPYVFVRNAYMQKRKALINEVVVAKHAPIDTDDNEFFDVEEEDSTS